jgi:hypothetical protein
VWQGDDALLSAGHCTSYFNHNTGLTYLTVDIRQAAYGLVRIDNGFARARNDSIADALVVSAPSSWPATNNYFVTNTDSQYTITGTQYGSRGLGATVCAGLAKTNVYRCGEIIQTGVTGGDGLYPLTALTWDELRRGQYVYMLWT